MISSSYSRNVFINCPFDEEYYPILQAIIFCIFDCKYYPRSALEISDAGIPRIEKLYTIINESRYGIHDISRTELSKSHNLPRFNMSLELGLFLGATRFGNNQNKQKICLVLDIDRYRYQIFCSDIAGQDIKAHSNDPKKVIYAIRRWMNSFQNISALPGASKIFERYERFLADKPLIYAASNLDEDDFDYSDYCFVVSEWLSEHSY